MQSIQDIKAQLIVLGNAAHDLRNVFAQYNKQRIPEVLAIDQISGQMEGIARRYAARIQNPIGPVKYAKGKEQLNNMLRQTNFFLRCLNTDPQTIGYQILPIDILKKVVENIRFQQQILRYIDDFLESSFKAKLGDNNLPIPNNSFKNEQIYKSLDFNKEINIEQCFNNPCITNLIDAARQTCNKAHNIQNIICFHIPNDQIKQDSQSINKLAGNLEDSYRNILNSFGQERNNIPYIKNIISTEIVQCESECQTIISISKRLERFISEDMKNIQNLCDQILLSVFFFKDVNQLQNISTN